jgi:uncharacterized protein (TIGR03905 family)
MIEYNTKGTCSSKIFFDLIDGKVHSVSFKDGCEGNLNALSILTEGMDAAELVRRLKGVRCGQKSTSCPDQLATAVEQAIAAGK